MLNYTVTNQKVISNLYDPDRKSKAGVPPLIELEYGVLISSVAPYLRKKIFQKG